MSRAVPAKGNNKLLDKSVVVTVLSLAVGTAGGWVSAKIETENRLTKLEIIMEEVRQDVKDLKAGVILIPVPSGSQLMEKYDPLEDPSQPHWPHYRFRAGADPIAACLAE